MHLTLHLTHACNLRCTYCYTGEKFPRGHMSEKVAIRAIDWSHETTPPGEEIDIVFFGGEPLVRRDTLERCVEHSQRLRAETRRPFFFKVITNGLLVDEAFLEFANRHEILISVSCDGVREAHDASRCDALGRGTWDRLEPRLRLIRRENPYAQVTLVVTPKSVRWLAESVEWLFGLRFRYLHLQVQHEAEWDRRSFRELRRQYRRLAELYVARMRRGEKFFLNCFDSKIHSYIQGETLAHQRCSVGRGQVSVAPSGRMYPCVSFVGADDREEHRVGDVWSGLDEEKLAGLACRMQRPKPSCEGCALTDRCSHWCACLNMRTTGRIDRVSPVVCEHERMLMPIADWVGNTLWKERNRLFLHKFYNRAYPVLSHLEETLEHWAEQRGISLDAVDEAIANLPDESVAFATGKE
ncbi:radical SAM protein [Candidatus Sumerlaeota bacterium]|nr:radical SAM protein [Candidatus Sumerlaeota bacterium]